MGHRRVNGAGPLPEMGSPLSEKQLGQNRFREREGK